MASYHTVQQRQEAEMVRVRYQIGTRSNQQRTADVTPARHGTGKPDSSMTCKEWSSCHPIDGNFAVNPKPCVSEC